MWNLFEYVLNFCAEFVRIFTNCTKLWIHLCACCVGLTVGAPKRETPYD